MAFQVVFAEILDKKVEETKVFSYTALRLRQIGEDLEKIKLVNFNKFRVNVDNLISLFNLSIFIEIYKYHYKPFNTCVKIALKLYYMA